MSSEPPTAASIFQYQQQFPSAWAWNNRSTTLRMSAVQVFPWWHSAPAFHAVFNWWAMATLATFSGLIRMDDVVIPETLRGPGGFLKMHMPSHAQIRLFPSFSFPFLQVSRTRKRTRKHGNLILWNPMESYRILTSEGLRETHFPPQDSSPTDSALWDDPWTPVDMGKWHEMIGFQSCLYNVYIYTYIYIYV